MTRKGFGKCKQHLGGSVIVASTWLTPEKLNYNIDEMFGRLGGFNTKQHWIRIRFWMEYLQAYHHHGSTTHHTHDVTTAFPDFDAALW